MNKLSDKFDASEDAAIDAQLIAELITEVRKEGCVSAWNKDPVSGVIGVQTRPH